MDTLATLNAALSTRYTVEREIGRGGMATVYLAQDVRHHRRVALKVLNPELGAVLGVERFLGEIRVTANLQHPNLLALFDSGEVGGLLFYVMPFVDGESLRARLDRERQLPVDDAIQIAIAVASALEYAHATGVVHRDLKPENILLQAGHPVVADFGIALAVSNAGGQRITQSGLSLGTPQYMSPEQATGDRAIDGRSDIYSLAAVLYEMLTGEPPHTGNTVQAVIARVLTEKPRSVRVSRETVPVFVEAAIDRALAKLPADRWASAREFGDALRGKTGGAVGTPAGAARATRTIQRSDTAPRVRRLVMPVTIAVVAALGVLVGMRLRPRAAPPTVARLTLSLPRDARFDGLVGGNLAISADGSTIVYGTGAGGRQVLFRRTLDDPRPQMIAGAEGGVEPFVSANGQWVGFFLNGALKKVSVTGGAPLVVVDSVPASHATWSENDQIAYVTSAGEIAVVSAAGGDKRVMVKASRGKTEMRLFDPYFLPGGRAVLFTVVRAAATTELAFTTLAGEWHGLGITGANPRFIAGHLVYSRPDGAVMAAPFDPSAGKITGPSWATGEFAQIKNGVVNMAISNNGTLVYANGLNSSEPVTVDANGVARSLGIEPRAFSSPRYSPDGRRIAFGASSGGQGEIWIHDTRSGTTRRLFAGPDVHQPEWSPDGTRIAFTAILGGTGEDIWGMPADGGAKPDMLVQGPGDQYDATWTRDGKSLVYGFDDTVSSMPRIGVYKLAGTSPSLPASTASEWGARVAPSGQLMAYVSDESGRSEIYVRPFPGPGGGTLVSTNGGAEPAWSRDGRQLFYREGNKLLAATLTATGAPSVESRRLVFDQAYVQDPTHVTYDVAPDGKSFLMLRPTDDSSSEIVVVLNWDEVLRRGSRAGAVPKP